MLMTNTGPQGRFNRVQRAVYNTDESMPLPLGQLLGVFRARFVANVIPGHQHVWSCGPAAPALAARQVLGVDFASEVLLWADQLRSEVRGLFAGSIRWLPAFHDRREVDGGLGALFRHHGLLLTELTCDKRMAMQ